MSLSPRDWTIIGFFACIVAAMIIAGIYGLDRDENWKWRVTTEENRVPAFFMVALMVAAMCLFIFGPKDA